jgi:hypothetical protein
MLSQDRTAAQQVLSPTTSQHLHCQSTQRYQPHSGSLSTSVLLSSAGAASQKHRNMPKASQYSSCLIPSENALPKPLSAQPDIYLVSLHQAHLRSPRPGNRQLPVDSQPLYRHVTDYVLPPTQLDNKLCAQSITLSMSQADLENVPSSSSGLLPGEPGLRTLKEGSVLYRLRCCK